EPVSRRVEPGLGFAAREPPGDSKMRRRDRPRNSAKKRLKASLARKRDRMPPRNPRKCRTFPRERRRSRKNRYAWLTRQSTAKRSLKPDSLLTGKRTGNFVNIGPFGEKW